MAKLTKFQRSQKAHKALYNRFMKDKKVCKAVYHEMVFREQQRAGTFLSSRGKKDIYDFCMR